MGPEDLENQPDDVAPQDQPSTKEQLKHERTLRRNSLQPGLSISQESEDRTDESIASGIVPGTGPEKPDEIKDKKDEYKASRALRKIGQSKQKAAKKLKSKSVKHKKKQYKRIKTIIRAIKLGSMAGTSMGDIIFSLTILFLTINGEWIYSKINENYPFDKIDTVILIAGWGIILSVLGLITFIIVMIMNLIN